MPASLKRAQVGGTAGRGGGVSAPVATARSSWVGGGSSGQGSSRAGDGSESAGRGGAQLLISALRAQDVVRRVQSAAPSAVLTPSASAAARTTMSVPKLVAGPGAGRAQGADTGARPVGARGRGRHNGCVVQLLSSGAAHAQRSRLRAEADAQSGTDSQPTAKKENSVAVLRPRSSTGSGQAGRRAPLPTTGGPAARLLRAHAGSGSGALGGKRANLRGGPGSGSCKRTPSGGESASVRQVRPRLEEEAAGPVHTLVARERRLRQELIRSQIEDARREKEAQKKKLDDMTLRGKELDEREEALKFEKDEFRKQMRELKKREDAMKKARDEFQNQMTELKEREKILKHEEEELLQEQEDMTRRADQWEARRQEMKREKEEFRQQMGNLKKRDDEQKRREHELGRQLEVYSDGREVKRARREGQVPEKEWSAAKASHSTTVDDVRCARRRTICQEQPVMAGPLAADMRTQEEWYDEEQEEGEEEWFEGDEEEYADAEIPDAEYEEEFNEEYEEENMEFYDEDCHEEYKEVYVDEQYKHVKQVKEECVERKIDRDHWEMRSGSPSFDRGAHGCGRRSGVRHDNKHPEDVRAERNKLKGAAAINRT